MTASAPPPGAPPGAIGLAQAEARWAAWRAAIWTANARRRGQGLRARVTARLGPDSTVLRAVTRVVEPAVVAWRRRRPRPVVRVGEFPAGAAV
ncbi:MAG TPA: hypothetical protein VGS61_03285, partial [Acidimicrobiales bacterium]|nr:hypothetical protein [Acidimicrobiales bacterium]